MLPKIAAWQPVLALPPRGKLVLEPAMVPLHVVEDRYHCRLAVLADVPGVALSEKPPATEVQVPSRGMGAVLTALQPLFALAGTLHVLPPQLVRVVIEPTLPPLPEPLPVHVAEAATVLQPLVLHM